MQFVMIRKFISKTSPRENIVFPFDKVFVVQKRNLKKLFSIQMYLLRNIFYVFSSGIIK